MPEPRNAASRFDRLRDPRGWLVDALPWPLRRCWLGVQLREWPWNVPNDCRIVGFRRPPQRVFDYFNELERREASHEALDTDEVDVVGQGIEESWADE